MSRIFIISVLLTLCASGSAMSQTVADSIRKSQASEVRRKVAGGKTTVSPSMAAVKKQISAEPVAAHDADLEYSRQIYRRLDLSKTPNAALAYPEEPVEGGENLFRIILRLVSGNIVPAFEYLDGREIFTEKFRIQPADIMKKFDINAKEVKVKGVEQPVFVVDDDEVPSSSVIEYYIIEKWEFDRRSNRMKTRVDAVCPVLTMSDDFGSESRYPMFWVKLNDINPYILSTRIFIEDDNNLERYSLSDFFSMGLYDGEIYKTKNVRNLTLAEMYPEEESLRHAQDSIDNRLKTYGKDLWVPSREEYLALKGLEGEKSSQPSSKSGGRRSAFKPESSKPKSVKGNSSGSPSNSSAVKSVRRRKR